LLDWQLERFMRTLGITLTFLLVTAVAAGAGKTTQSHEQQTLASAD